jgi:glycosyltransferase involved in cell wall biosynthesis
MMNVIHKAKKFLTIIYPQKKKKASVQFSVITAIFNTGQYLNDFFSSLVRQKNFLNSIEIICIDDGSTDNSVDIIKKWQKEYPRNIQYYYQENAGPGAARNLGLQVATGDWITFIDSDDFVAEDYFSIVEEAISSNIKSKLIICNHFTYFEKTNKVVLEHPLKFRFTRDKVQLTLSTTTKFVHLLVNSAFFERSSIYAADISFNPEMRPTFEDGEFVLGYLLGVKKPRVLLLRNAKYFHRMRISDDSLYSSAKMAENHYVLHFKAGLRILEKEYSEKLCVPQFIQQTFLYLITRYYNKIIRNCIELDEITPGLNERFTALLRNIFTYIDTDSILKPYFPFLSEELTMYFLKLFKSKEPPFRKIHILKYDAFKQQLLVQYFSTESAPDVSFFFNMIQAKPAYSKIMEKKNSGSPVYYKHCSWLQFSKHDHCIAAHSDMKRCRFIFIVKKQKVENIASLDGIVRILTKEPYDSKFDKAFYIKKIVRSVYYKNRYANSWVFMDRDIQADDNAEHMYRFIAKKYPQIKIFFYYVGTLMIGSVCVKKALI